LFIGTPTWEHCGPLWCPGNGFLLIC